MNLLMHCAARSQLKVEECIIYSSIKRILTPSWMILSFLTLPATSTSKAGIASFLLATNKYFSQEDCISGFQVEATRENSCTSPHEQNGCSYLRDPIVCIESRRSLSHIKQAEACLPR